MSLSPAGILRIKRDGGRLTDADIAEFITGIGTGRVSEGQIGAFTMAVYQHGMNAAETAALTLAMRDSGTVIDWSATGLPSRCLIEKHSSGGTGDEKVSLILAPLVAACGVHMPMITARGLGHTGGEVDLIEATGAAIALSPDELRHAVMEAGTAIVGPGPDIAPADAAIYRVRDVTATVESVALITSSILSKKLASGASGLVMSVNYGSAAFMADAGEAATLAASLIGTAELAALPMVVPIVQLNEVMGSAVGSYPQLHEVLRFLSGGARDPRLEELVMGLSIEVLLMAGIVTDTADARKMLALRLADGSALARFWRMIGAMGGRVEGDPDILWPLAPERLAVVAPVSGYVAVVDAFAVGMAMVGLGAGRRLPDDRIDHGVGLSDMVHVGDRIETGQPLCILHARDPASARIAATAILDAITVIPDPVPRPQLFTGRMTTVRGLAGSGLSVDTQK